MPTELISPIELPSTLGSWLWEHMESLGDVSIVARNDGEAILRLDVDPPMEGDLREALEIPYLYIDIAGNALFAVVAESILARQAPGFGDFRAGLRAAEWERQQDAERVDRELDQLRRFKQQVMSFATPVLAVFGTILLLRACF